MIADFINTLLEMTSVFFLHYTLSSQRFTAKNVFAYILVSILLSLFFISFERPILIVNCSFIILAQILCLSSLTWLSRLIYAALTVLCLAYLELMSFSLMPVAWLQTNVAHYSSNIPLLVLSILLYHFSHKHQVAQILEPHLLRHPALVLGVSVVTFLFGQFYLSRLSSIWTYLPGIVTLLVFTLYSSSF